MEGVVIGKFATAGTNYRAEFFSIWLRLVRGAIRSEMYSVATAHQNLSFFPPFGDMS